MSNSNLIRYDVVTRIECGLYICVNCKFLPRNALNKSISKSSATEMNEHLNQHQYVGHIIPTVDLSPEKII